jgi:hypothetical protein
VPDVQRPHSELREVLIGLNERLPAGPWFYEPGVPAGGDRTGSVWARYGDTLDLVMSKPNVATAERLVVLRNALPEIIDLFEQLEATREVARWNTSLLKDAIYALLNQPDLSRSDIAAALQRDQKPLASSPASRQDDA